MVALWQPGTQYNHGDVVEYEGNEYKIIQPHFSQGDWAPNITPALWGKLQKSHHQGGGHQQQPQQQQYQPQQQQQQQQQSYQPPQNQSYDSGKQEQDHSNNNPEKKNWFEEHKEGLMIGGGIAAGVGTLGAGIAAYEHHEHKEEQKKSFEAWVSAARARRNQPRGPATWVFNEGKNIPPNAISTGTEHDWTLYICRSFKDGGIQIGKASNVFQEGAVIGYAHKEYQISQYEILLGDMRGLKWVQTGNTLNVESLGAKPVEGGYENDGTPLYVARAYHKGAKHPGKASTKLDGAFIPYDGTEKKVKEYEILCYA